MDDRNGLPESVKELYAVSAIWWWRWWWCRRAPPSQNWRWGRNASPKCLLSLHHLLWQINNKIFLGIYPTPPHRLDVKQGQLFQAKFNRFQSRVFLLLDWLHKQGLPDYLLIVGEKIIGFITFPRVLVQWEMQLASSRIWTRDAVFISCDDDHGHLIDIYFR